MPWVRIDDQFPEHEKIMSLTLGAKWLHVTALCYCSRNLTDGAISRHQTKVICAVARVPRAAAQVQLLVDAGLWHDEGEGCYQINDYTEFNPPAERVKEEREKARERMRSLRSSRARSGEQQTNDRPKFADPLPQPLSPKEETPTRDAAPLRGLVTHEYKASRLIAAAGGGPTAQRKIANALRGHTITEHDLDEIIDSCTKRSVKDPLAVALSELVKRRKGAA